MTSAERGARWALCVAFGLALQAVSTFAAAPSAGTAGTFVEVVVNGQSLGRDGRGRIVAGRVLLPLRAVLGALNVAATRSGGTITAETARGKVVLTIGRADALIGGATEHLDTAPRVIDGAEYVSLRLIAAAFGATTSYDAAQAQVDVTSEAYAETSGTHVRGIVSAIDKNTQPPTVTVSAHGSARTISVNSDAPITIEDVAISSRLRATLANIQVGDAVLIVLAKDGRVVEVEDFVRTTSGKVRAVAPNAVVMAGGLVLSPSSATEVTVNQAVAHIGDLQPGDEVTVRRNPDTGEVREIIATRASNATPPPAAALRITSFSISATRPLHAGESFAVEMHGTPRGRATFDIGNFVTANAMREDGPGIYRGRFTIPERFNLAQVPVYGHLAVNGTEAARAEAAAQLSAATTPPSILDVAPPPGETVNTSRPNIYATFQSPAEVGIDAASIHIAVNGTDVTSSSTRSQTFVTYTPPADYPNGTVSVTVRVADAAGNGAARSWSFAVKAR